ncbi:hypothetical protein HanPI659440_Chr12g0468451 [Helianthus annuus]|nr:hypothetical protein HanPI659440_Chr12g0468451 [Helianthus annuus]
MAVRGSEVVFILARKGRCERASIDEVVSYKPPVISTFSIHDLGTKIKWAFKGFNFISHIFDGGCMPLRCINCLLFYNTSAGLKISILKLRYVLMDFYFFMVMFLKDNV